MGGKSGLVTFTFPPCARRLLDSMTATSPRALSTIRPPGQGGREGSNSKKGKWGFCFSRTKYRKTVCPTWSARIHPHITPTPPRPREDRRKSADLERNMPSSANHQSLTSNATTPAQTCRNSALWRFSFLAFQSPSRWSGLLNSDPHGQWQCLSLLTLYYFFPSYCLKHAYYVLRIRYVSENQTNNDCKSQICYDVASSTE